MSDVVGIGQCSIDLLGTVADWPEPDSKVELPELVVQGGGPVATALVTLARLGIDTAIQGAIGTDDAGRQIRAGLEGEGVDCSRLQTFAGTSSQTAFIVVEPNSSRRTIFWHRGAAKLTPDQLDADQIRAARFVHLDGLHLDLALHAATIARQAGVTTVFDGGTLRDGVEELLPLIDHPVVSERFSEAMSPSDPLRCCDMLLDHGATAATVTLGAKGSVTRLASGETFHRPAFPVEVVDTTGCGDVFHGAYIFGLMQGWPWPALLAFAAACAALKSREIGGRGGIPNFETLKTFLAEQGIKLP